MSSNNIIKNLNNEEEEDDIVNLNIKTNPKSSSSNIDNDEINKQNLILDHSNLSIIDLVNKLKEKLLIYENEIQKLIDEKIKLQLEINNLQLTIAKNKKKNQISENSNNNNDNNLVSLIDINTKLIKDNNEMKKELDLLKELIDKQKILIENLSINPPQNKISTTNSSEIQCKNCAQKNEELLKLTNEKQEICVAINELKKQLEELKNNEKKRKNKKKKKEKINKNDSLPSIEQYFILNNKFQLVDSERNLWHMKKCQKFQNYKEKHKNEFSSSEDILKAFVDSYETKSDDENSASESEKKNNIIKNNNKPPTPNNNNIKNEINQNKEILSLSEDNKDMNKFNKNNNNKEDESLSLSDND